MHVSAQLLNGKALAREIQSELAERVAKWKLGAARTACLTAVLVGEDPASEVYVRNKRRACERVGIDGRLVRLPADASRAELLSCVEDLNRDDAVHGILVQLPLPSHIDATEILDRIDPRKDVDAFHPENVGRLSQGRPRFLPCTPHGVVQMLHRHDIPVSGRHVVVVGRSDIVGKPLAMMLAQRDSPLGDQWANATVTLCHSRTPDLPAHTRRADVLVAAVGRAEMITAEHVKPGATVIDVGINRTDAGLVGDVEQQSVAQVAAHLTPVPGGIGPLTVTMLLDNTFRAAQALV